MPCLLLSWCEDEGCPGDISRADGAADHVGARVAAVLVAAAYHTASALRSDTVPF